METQAANPDIAEPTALENPPTENIGLCQDFK